MENPTPFDLNDAIRRWQQSFGSSPAFEADDLEELASHLRASIQKLKADGRSEEEAFQMAVRRIGECRSLEQEFGKVNLPEPWSWSVLLFWIVYGVYLSQVAYSLIFVILCFRELMDGRAFSHFMNHAPSIQQINAYINLHSHFYSRPLFHLTSVLTALIFIVFVRSVAGSWKYFHTFKRSFDRPVCPALGLIVLGLIVTILPAFLPGLLSPIASVHGKIWAPPDGTVGRAAVNVALVLVMVLLARRGPRQLGHFSPSPTSYRCD